MNSVSTNSSRITDYLDPSTSGNFVAVSPVTCEPLPDLMLTKISPVPSSTSSTTPEPPLDAVKNTSRSRISKQIKIETSSPIGGRKSSRSTAGKTSREWGRTSISSDSTWTIASSVAAPGNRKKKRLRLESESEPDSGKLDNEDYRGARQRNNEASRRSRMNKRAKEFEMSTKASQLEKDNRVLRMRVDELEKLVDSMRNALLRSALKKETKN